MSSVFQALFCPRSIALIGASGEPGKNTARPQQFLRRHGWTGSLYPVNRSRRELFGEPAWPTLDEVPGPIDHAFVMVPAPQVIEALEACARKGVPLVTVYSDGFAEAGELALQQALVDRARQLGVRLLGPNCIGVIDVVGRMPLTVNASLAGELSPAGQVAVISQSGSMLGALLSRGQARGTGFSRLVSVGNEADLGVGEIAQWLVDDPHTRVILLFLETLRDAPRLALAARRARACGKALVAYVLGRSPQGAQLAVSHTGALAGEAAAFDAFFRAHGILSVDQLETLLEIAPLLATPARARAGRPQTPRNQADQADQAEVPAPRVAVVSTTGGGAAMVVDRLGLKGVHAAAPPAEFIDQMAAQGIALRAAPIIDLTLAATPAKYAAVLRGLMAADFCDAVLAVAGSSAQFQPALAVEPMIRVQGERDWGKPLVAFLAPQAEASLTLLAQHGVAAFRTPEACADALAAVLHDHGPVAGPDALPPALQARLVSLLRPASQTGTPASVSACTTDPGPVLDEVQSLDLFDALGVPTVGRVLLHQAPWVHPFEGPVAAKLVSPDLPHKTEAGAVELDLRHGSALDAAIEGMRERVAQRVPDARVRGVLIQPMTRGLMEVLIGYRHDPLVGPLLTLAAGGRLAEVLRDSVVRVAPVSLSTAQEMIAAVRSLALVRGWRGLPRGDTDALARAMVAFSQLALVPGQPVAEAEANPVIVRSDGVTAVDGLVVLRSPRAVT
jgi:acyl-CoA synthetase (NDP forming)